MPKQSLKSKIMEFKISSAIQEMDFIEDILRPEQCHNATDEVLEELLEDITLIICSRRGDELHVPKSIHWRENVLCFVALTMEIFTNAARQQMPIRSSPIF
ncbi:uncharacterized protein LOC120779755 [Bactrocera tryoni]|uniref:uncharacterized protein LOC120779755 n=1 Tax=Bactrocera tryoni TaxID=59916 RepID=UPI001A9667DC|nr:uncharacterized protein LOC120779755 [Bactrocera tryoni]